MITFPNPKINIGLNILKRRDDGFHDIETVFIPLTEEYGYHEGELKDRLEITPRTDGLTTLKIHRAEESMPEDSWPKDKDLCIKAYNELAAHYPLTGADIVLAKGIPTGAGLGGGSADAAFTLRMLNEIYSLGLSPEQLAMHGARIGSDIPFFIYNRPMLATGRGEILTPIQNPVPSRRIGVVTPGITVSTAEAYSGVTPSVPETRLHELVSGLDISQWKGRVVNDFEENIFKKHPALRAIKDSLYEAGAAYASMSGSGSAIYGIF